MWFVQDAACSAPQICALNDSPRNLTLVGTVVRDADVQDRTVNLRVAVESVTYRNTANPDGVTEAVEGTILVSSLRFPVIEYGTRLTITGRLATPFESPDFSYKDVLAREGVYSTMFLPRVEVAAEGVGNPLLAAIFRVKGHSAEIISRIIPAPQSGLLKAILLGDKSDLPDVLEDDFRTAGLSHLIAISGFHVGIIMLTVLTVADAFLKRTPALAVTVVILLLYGTLVGWRPSVVRAVAMGLAYLFASRILGRRNATVGVLAAVAIAMLLWEPQLLWSVGFQLSFAATLGIALFAGTFEKWMRKQVTGYVLAASTSSGQADLIKGWFGRILTILAVTLAAQLLTLPLIAWHFEEIALISIFSNLLVVPAQPFAMLLGGLATLIGAAIEPLGSIVGWLAYVPLAYTTQLVELLARIPYASVPIRVSTFTLFSLYAMIGGAGWYGLQGLARRVAIRERIAANFTQKALAIGSCAAAVLTLAWSGAQPDGKLHLHFFDVGQGDATLIVTPSGRQILIDGGYFPSVMNAHIGRNLPFYDSTIDIVIATHPDADHVTGLPNIFDRYEVGQFIYDGNLEGTSSLYDATLERLELHNVERKVAVLGEVIEVGDGVRLEIVHPDGDLDDEIRNNNSVSIRLVYGEFSALLTGDAEKEAEREMLQSGLPLQSLVYKVGHHGSRTSSTQPFLDAVQPQIAVISAGEENKFGHPHQEVVERLQAMGIAILDTRELGTIEVVTDGVGMWWYAKR